MGESGVRLYGWRRRVLTGTTNFGFYQKTSEQKEAALNAWPEGNVVVYASERRATDCSASAQHSVGCSNKDALLFTQSSQRYCCTPWSCGSQED